MPKHDFNLVLRYYLPEWNIVLGSTSSITQILTVPHNSNHPI